MRFWQGAGILPQQLQLSGWFDGGVAEVSYDHGLTFQDVLAAGGTFFVGGYNGTINSCCGNPLAGRQTWTGNSAGFIDTTVVNLPDGCVVDIILRWRMGSDSSISGEGWRIDNVNIVQCHAHFPPRRRDTPTPPASDVAVMNDDS